MKVETDLLYQNYALFLQATKSFGKNLKQNHYFPFETSTFKSMCTILKWMHSCTQRVIARYDSTFILIFSLNLSMSMAQFCFT